jgi:hypothetical protein
MRHLRFPPTFLSLHRRPAGDEHSLTDNLKRSARLKNVVIMTVFLTTRMTAVCADIVFFGRLIRAPTARS